MQQSSFLDTIRSHYRANRPLGDYLFGSLRWPILVLASLLPLLLLTTVAPGTAHAAVCGDSIVDPAEECDDGNNTDGDCCSSICEYEPAGSLCGADGNDCTDDICDGAGLCTHPGKPDQTLLSFVAEADTYSNSKQGSRDRNYGDYGVLEVDESPGKRTYLRFNVTGMAGLRIQTAVVRLYTTDASKAGSPDGGTIHAVSDNSWDEMTLTHNDRPAIDGPALSSAGWVDPSQAVDFDVTAAVSGDDTYSFGIEPDSTNKTIYASREDAARKPELIITVVAICDDGDACTTNDTCIGGLCVGGEAPDCDDANLCTDDSCDPATGCVNANNASPCDDGDACTTNDTCDGGSCVGGEAPDCNDANLCTDDSCDPATGCVNANNTSPCDDDNACTTNDTCDGGSCVGGVAPNCDDDNVCTDDSCDPATGCVNANNTSPCDDGNACTTVDTCSDGSCVGAAPIDCDDGNVCTDEICDPATGSCSNPNNTASCDDGDPCTTDDTCSGGACVGGVPPSCDDDNVCTDDSCDSAIGCVHTNNTNPCDDGNACTQTDSCVAGICTGANPVTCTASDQCHEAGECSPATGQCSDPAKADGSPCDDGNACTQTDTCVTGICAGANPVTCATTEECRDAGSCDPATGECSIVVSADGSSCDDGNACTQTDTCVAGVCTGANPVTCTAADQCHEAGTCSPATGRCSNPAKTDGSPCDDGDRCSDNDVCLAGECLGEVLLDRDEDGYCDAVDLCPQIPNPAQLDTDNDGVGDLCQCTSPAPGRCIAGGGSKRSDCLLELTSPAPVTFNRRGTKVKSFLQCTDGDQVCDLDGARDGQCTFGVAFCFGNADPRYPRCTPSPITSTEVLRPSAKRSGAAKQIEQAFEALGIGVRRRGRTIAESTTSVGNSNCSPLIKLVTPAPKKEGGRPSRRKFQVRATAVNGKRDKDRFTLVCR